MSVADMLMLQQYPPLNAVAITVLEALKVIHREIRPHRCVENIESRLHITSFSMSPNSHRRLERDVASRNIFLSNMETSEMQVKLGGFGNGRGLQDTSSVSSHFQLSVVEPSSKFII